MQKKAQKIKTIYFDVDDVALNSLQTSIKIINELYNKPNNLTLKTEQNAKDWEMKSIHRNLTKTQLEQIFSSNDFWEKVQIRPEFISLLTKEIRAKYKIVFVTKGDQHNLELKKDFLDQNLKYFEEFEYIGLPLSFSKNIINMSDGIFIDDNIENLIESNAAIKILLTNDNETCYNNAFNKYAKEDITTIYIFNTLSQIKDFLEFNLKQNLKFLSL